LRRNTLLRTAAAAGLTALSLLFWGCSGRSVPEKGVKEQSQAKTAPEAAAPVDETIPPILRTSWKGDLDGMVKRRLVRVLLPFRRPEFF